MSTASVPPRRAYHLRVFAISLVIVVVCLVAFLFGVRMEAIVPAAGVIGARDQQELRAPLGGLIELGWYEGELPQNGTPLRVRVDRHGNGVADPGHGGSRRVTQYRIDSGLEIPAENLRFHKLAAGDELWPGQICARIDSEKLELELTRLKARLADLESTKQPAAEVRTQIQTVQGELAKANIVVPDDTNHWLVLKVHPAARQAVAAGDPVALVAPLDPATHQPKALIALLDVQEKHTGELLPGQPVRIYSTMYNQRLHGHANGHIERLEPLAEPIAGGERHVRAVAAITAAPFTLRVGSSFKAEVVIGRKQVYRIILEQ
jgi:hypothetical protein